jgi:hypothetical protein
MLFSNRPIPVKLAALVPVLIVLGIVVLLYKVFVLDAVLLPMIQNDEASTWQRALWAVQFVVYEVFVVLFLWSYTRIITVPGGGCPDWLMRMYPKVRKWELCFIW